MNDNRVPEWLCGADGVTLGFYFVLNGEIQEWKPAVGLVVTHRFYDPQVKAIGVAYLSQLGRNCCCWDVVDQLAKRLNWPEWGKPITLPMRRDTGAD